MEHGRKYLVIIETAADGSYSAYVPDLPGCAAVGLDTAEEARRAIAEAIEFHIEGLIAEGDLVPEPKAKAEYVEA
ncbi:MAG TPA: type II toxin-antitoxin system HicB family antitoxin [Phycisphaerae bacterium]|nr:type II toxin-antitoxin system HicB family antitoxin [Phycisphaerae bacterium]